MPALILRVPTAQGWHIHCLFYLGSLCFLLTFNYIERERDREEVVPEKGEREKVETYASRTMYVYAYREIDESKYRR